MSGRPRNIAWSHQHIQLLTTMWQAGATLPAIAAALSEQGRMCTAAALVSKIARLGLAARAPARVNPQQPPPSPKGPTPPRTVAACDSEEALEPPRSSPPQKKAPPGFAAPAVYLVERRANQCAWPIAGGGAELVVCGRPVALKRSYCPDCTAAEAKRARERWGAFYKAGPGLVSKVAGFVKYSERRGSWSANASHAEVSALFGGRRRGGQ